jgi:hypothetical protein
MLAAVAVPHLIAGDRAACEEGTLLLKRCPIQSQAPYRLATPRWRMLDERRIE